MKLAKAFIAGFALFFLAPCALPCLWVMGTKYNTKGAWVSGVSAGRRLQYALAADRRPDGAKMEAELRGSTNYNDRSDYSVALMYLGRSQEAIELLQQLEQEKPGQYFVAANLGTAYELSGDNEHALRWISEGIQRDPKSHEGTEWLHVRILEAKIAQQKDPAFFEQHSVLELNPAQIGEQLTIRGQHSSPEKLAEAIQYQLTERLQFVKPPDAPVASLLFDYAAIEAATKSLESAKTVLQLALQYGYPPNKVQPLLMDFDRRIAWRKTKQYGFFTLLGLTVIGVLAVLYKRGIFVLSARDLKKSRRPPQVYQMYQFVDRLKPEG